MEGQWLALNLQLQHANLGPLAWAPGHAGTHPPCALFIALPLPLICSLLKPAHLRQVNSLLVFLKFPPQFICSKSSWLILPVNNMTVSGGTKSTKLLLLSGGGSPGHNALGSERSHCLGWLPVENPAYRVAGG